MRQLFRIKMHFFLIILMGTLALAPKFASAEDEINENPLHATIKVSPFAIPPGGQGQIIIDISIDPPYKAYVDKFKLKAVEPKDIHVGQFELSPTIEFKDTFSGEIKKGIKKQATMTALMELPTQLSLQETPVEFALTYQACTDKHCLFPKTIPLKLTIDVSQTGAGQEKSDSSTGQNKQNNQNELPGQNIDNGALDFTSAMAKGTFYAFLFVFLAGILTSLTPCVFPMIPITLAILGTRTAGQSKARSLALSLVYVLGIAMTYATLGVFAAKTGALFGAALSNPWVVSAIACLFVAMGFSMYGAFEIQPPAFIRQRLGTHKGGTGLLGVFVSGLIAGIVASPCVGPVLVSILTYVAQTQDGVLGFWLLFTFALGLGVLFIVLGTSSSMVSRLPRAGTWMDAVKFVFGTAMIGMAIYYIAPLASQRFFDAAMALALISISSFYGAFRSNESLASDPKKQWLKGLMLTGFIVGIVFTLFAVFGRFTPASIGPNAGPSTSFKKLDWQPYSSEALKKAAADGKPVIIDFFADWCGACKELELLTFSTDRVQAEGKSFRFFKIDATEESAELRELMKTYKVMGLPTLIFIDSKGDIRWDLTLTGFEDETAFLKRMRALNQQK